MLWFWNLLVRRRHHVPNLLISKFRFLFSSIVHTFNTSVFGILIFRDHIIPEADFHLMSCIHLLSAGKLSQCHLRKLGSVNVLANIVQWRVAWEILGVPCWNPWCPSIPKMCFKFDPWLVWMPVHLWGRGNTPLHVLCILVTVFPGEIRGGAYKEQEDSGG